MGSGFVVMADTEDGMLGPPDPNRLTVSVPASKSRAHQQPLIRFDEEALHESSR
jgi:hypothetical protein